MEVEHRAADGGGSFKDTSTECAICLSPLDSAETIELTCGHLWHLDCLKEQLAKARPDKSRRLLFSGARCAKCGTHCDHESLRDLTRRTDDLRDEVDRLIVEQLRADKPGVWEGADERARGKLVEEGRRTYAFYLCGSCDGPFFGGTVDCAVDDEDEEEEHSGAGSRTRLCPACAPAPPRAVCRRPAEHRTFHVWKCRYCCRPASRVCYGSVHFCDGCHGRNSERVRLARLRRRAGSAARAGGEGPPPLEAIPCRGGEACRHPKPDGRDVHSNGPSRDCEQVYRCVRCESRPSGDGGADADIVAAGTRNFVVNPSGAQGLRGWRQLNPRMSWEVERSEVPSGDGAAAAGDGSFGTNFVSGFQWCVMAQTVPLHLLVNDPSSARIEVSAKFMGRTDCPSTFRMEAVVLDERRREIQRASTPELDAPADGWERSTLVVGPIDGAWEVAMVVFGKDGRFWQGRFGSKVAECSVRVLCAESELADVVRGGPNIGQGEPEQRQLMDGNRNLARLDLDHGQRREGQERVRGQLRDHWFDALLLPMAAIVLLWMMSD